ncbi:hypothetical protein AX774_g7156 [Zancudomyces culisetae]|uniref:Uncharacterized protein n=1 Tax=Zancudomyces culisetae TaxID=1213189 RepID=A0A1R1PET3_ZANCU|nr:hypothetical protein AX774_g7156 [Zancudomyces culisetae]|eukprot:OMH79423.1 hypothetical protein AX774_g7156 [Zancudomyces culisetae]
MNPGQNYNQGGPGFPGGPGGPPQRPPGMGPGFPGGPPQHPPGMGPGFPGGPGGPQQSHAPPSMGPGGPYGQGGNFGAGYGAPGPVSAQVTFQWVAAKNGKIPPNAVQGGVERDGKPLYVGRAFYKGGLHPGKCAPHLEDGGFAFGYGGKEVRLNEYFVLCGDASKLRWVEQTGSLRISNFRPLEAGHEADGEALYVAKAAYEGGQVVGKCGQHLKEGMTFSYGKKEKNSSSYMVLCIA